MNHFEDAFRTSMDEGKQHFNDLMDFNGPTRDPNGNYVDKIQIVGSFLEAPLSKNVL